MFLLDKRTGDLVRVVEIEELFNPLKDLIWGRDQAGEEEQDPTVFAKEHLVFPSGEPLPRCWVDVHYRDATMARETAGRAT